MKDVNVLITNIKNSIVVDVTVNFRSEFDKRITLRTIDIKEYLRSKNIEFTKVIKTGFINNDKLESIKSQWIFEKPNISKKRKITKNEKKE